MKRDLEFTKIIDPLVDELIPLSKVPKRLKNRPAYSTIWRWRMHGIRGVKLEVVLLGTKPYTTAAALRAFFEAVTAVSNGEKPKRRTTKQRARAVAKAEKELDKSGV